MVKDFDTFKKLTESAAEDDAESVKKRLGGNSKIGYSTHDARSTGGFSEPDSELKPSAQKLRRVLKEGDQDLANLYQSAYENYYEEKIRPHVVEYLNEVCQELSAKMHAAGARKVVFEPLLYDINPFLWTEGYAHQDDKDDEMPFAEAFFRLRYHGIMVHLSQCTSAIMFMGVTPDKKNPSYWKDDDKLSMQWGPRAKPQDWSFYPWLKDWHTSSNINIGGDWGVGLYRLLREMDKAGYKINNLSVWEWLKLDDDTRRSAVALNSF